MAAISATSGETSAPQGQPGDLTHRIAERRLRARLVSRGDPAMTQINPVMGNVNTSAVPACGVSAGLKMTCTSGPTWRTLKNT